MNGPCNTVGGDGHGIENKPRATERLHEKLRGVLSHMGGLNSSACEQLNRLNGGLPPGVHSIDECGSTIPSGMLAEIDQTIDALAAEACLYESILGQLQKL